MPKFMLGNNPNAKQDFFISLLSQIPKFMITRLLFGLC